MRRNKGHHKQSARNLKTWRRLMFVLALPACLVFWFVTAPASMAVQRIAAGTGNGPIARFIISAADWYVAPMGWIYQFPGVKKFNDSLADRWCELLQAPETTP